MSNAAARHLLSLTARPASGLPLGATSFCSFTVTDAGVRVVAYGTHTSYVNDQMGTREEARAAWRSLIAKGYAVTAG